MSIIIPGCWIESKSRDLCHESPWKFTIKTLLNIVHKRRLACNKIVGNLACDEDDCYLSSPAKCSWGIKAYDKSRTPNIIVVSHLCPQTQMGQGLFFFQQLHIQQHHFNEMIRSLFQNNEKINNMYLEKRHDLGSNIVMVCRHSSPETESIR